MEIFIYYFGTLDLANDEVEDTLTEELADLSCEVTGTGGGNIGGNFDLMIADNISERDAAVRVARILKQLGFAENSAIVSDNLRVTVGEALR